MTWVFEDDERAEAYNFFISLDGKIRIFIPANRFTTEEHDAMAPVALQMVNRLAAHGNELCQRALAEATRRRLAA